MSRGKRIRGLDDHGQRTIYGVHPIREALRAGRVVHRIYVRKGERRVAQRVAREAGAEPGAIEEISEARLARLAGTPQHQGLVAHTEPLQNASLNHIVREKGEGILALLLDGVQDPHNMGAIFRVADGAGVDLVVVPSRGGASVQLGSVSRASAGAIEHVPLLVVGDTKRCLGEFQEHGFRVLGLEAGAGAPLGEADLRPPLCLVLGGEDKGIRPRTREACTGMVHVPLRGRVNSLNVSVAAALATFAASAARP